MACKVLDSYKANLYKFKEKLEILSSIRDHRRKK